MDLTFCNEMTKRGRRVSKKVCIAGTVRRGIDRLTSFNSAASPLTCPLNLSASA